MSRIAVLLAACAVAASACGDRSPKGKGGPAAQAGSGEVLTTSGVVAVVKEDGVQVKTDDGRVLNLALGKETKVTLAGGEADIAVVSEGAPVRVSYKPTEKGGAAVTIDVEPNAPKAGSPGPQSGPTAQPKGAAPAGGKATDTGSR
jgi:ABC-type Fe3+-hydroxamate transport system substrate-binding protein